MKQMSESEFSYSEEGTLSETGLTDVKVYKA